MKANKITIWRSLSIVCMIIISQFASGQGSISSALAKSDSGVTTTAPISTNISGHYYVSTTGSDANPGSQAAPWRTIQKAVNTVASGNTVNVLAGNYPEFISTGKSGITFVANGKVNMKGFYLTGSNNRVSGFTITNPASDYGIRVTGNNNIIEKNEISNTKQDGIWFFGSGNKFIGNYIYDIVDRSKITNDPHVDCFQTWGPAENIVFEKNICDHTNTYGSNQIAQISNLNQPVRNITFKNNIFIMHDPGYSPMTFYHMDGQSAISNMYVINNTFVHVNGIGTAAIWFRNITGAYAINNLFIDYGTAGASYIKADASTGLQIQNNAVYKSDKVVPMGGMLSNDIWILDPGLVDYKNGDFRLKSTSVLINKGFNASSWTIDDFDGIPRPQGTGFDIGAFESSAESSTTSTIFSDVPSNHWAWNSIERLYNAGVTSGCGNGQFCPDNVVTRDQIAVFLLKAKGITSSAATGTMFSDIPASHWAAAWVEELANAGITTGCGNGKFCPDGVVTRDQMAVFLLKTKGMTPPTATGTIFSDVPANHWAAAWIEELANQGITAGCGNGKFCPDNPVTRAQMAVFLVKMFNLP
jgi:parallel beta-helix repeat protein